jgi:hypothetical protein
MPEQLLEAIKWITILIVLTGCVNFTVWMMFVKDWDKPPKKEK